MHFKCRPVETGGAEGSRPPLEKKFAKVNLLPIDNNSAKKKVAKKIRTGSNFSKTTGNMTLAHFMKCIKLILIDILCCVFYLLPWWLSLQKTIFHKTLPFTLVLETIGVYSIGVIMPFPLGLYSIGSINHAFSIGATFKHWT